MLAAVPLAFAAVLRYFLFIWSFSALLTPTCCSTWVDKNCIYARRIANAPKKANKTNNENVKNIHCPKVVGKIALKSVAAPSTRLRSVCMPQQPCNFHYSFVTAAATFSTFYAFFIIKNISFSLAIATLHSARTILRVRLKWCRVANDAVEYL